MGGCKVALPIDKLPEAFVAKIVFPRDIESTGIMKNLVCGDEIQVTIDLAVCELIINDFVVSNLLIRV